MDLQGAGSKLSLTTGHLSVSQHYKGPIKRNTMLHGTVSLHKQVLV